MTLIEVLVALAILVGFGVPLLERLDSYQRERIRLRGIEGRQRVQSGVLDQLVLLPRGELDRLIGRREVAGFEVLVDRPTATIYRIEVRPDTSAAGRPLVTLVHRERGSR